MSKTTAVPIDRSQAPAHRGNADRMQRDHRSCLARRFLGAEVNAVPGASLGCEGKDRCLARVPRGALLRHLIHETQPSPQRSRKQARVPKRGCGHPPLATELVILRPAADGLSATSSNP
jgi:hypothetical protein